TGSWTVGGNKVRQPTEMLGCFLRGFRDDRDVQAAADHLSDLAERHGFVGDAVIPGSWKTFLKHEPVQPGSIESMHRGPPIEPIPNICRNAFFTGDVDQGRNEAVIALAMH